MGSFGAKITPPTSFGILQEPRAGALAQLSHEPDATNVGHREPFFAVMQMMFYKLDLWKKKTPHYHSLLCDFELHLIQRRYADLVEANSAWARNKNIHKWIWGIFKKIQKMDQTKRNDVLRHVIGDYKKYSLNPTGRKGPTRAAAEKADEEGDLADPTTAAAPSSSSAAATSAAPGAPSAPSAATPDAPKGLPYM